MALSHYEILGLAPTADAQAIARAFAALEKECAALPEGPQRTERERALGLAVQTLLDPAKRSEYDATLVGAVSPAQTPTAAVAEPVPPDPKAWARLAREAFLRGDWASLKERSLAGLSDATVLYFGLYPLAILFALVAGSAGSSISLNRVIGIAGILAWFSFLPGYRVSSPTLGSWGLRKLGLAVVSAESGEPIGLAKSCLRALLSALSFILVVPDLVPIFTAKRQTLADLACRTVVVRVASPVRAERRKAVALCAIGIVFNVGVYGFLLPYLALYNALDRITPALSDCKALSQLVGRHFQETGKIETSLEALGYHEQFAHMPYGVHVDSQTMVVYATSVMDQGGEDSAIGLAPARNAATGEITWTCVSKGVPEKYLKYGQIDCKGSSLRPWPKEPFH